MSEYIIEWFDIGGQLTRLCEGNVPLVLWPKLIREERRREKIVRCRDCKHHELQGVSYSDKLLSVCTAEWCEGSEHDNPLVEPDGFCAWGERI